MLLQTLKILLGLGLFSVFANASPLGILEVHPDKGARDIQSASILYLSQGSDGTLQVTYAVCKDPSRDFSKKCLASGLSTQMSWVEYDNEVLGYLKLDRYRVLRDIVNGGNESVQIYSNSLKPVADSLTPDQSKKVEADLEKGVSAIEAARAEMKQIQTKSPDYLIYNAILSPLQSEDVTEGVVREPLYSTVNDLSVKAALLPFRLWRSENLCSCRLFQDGNGKYCRLSLGRDELGWKTAAGPEDCDSREACLAGKWYRGAITTQETQRVESSFTTLLNERCRGYFEARSLPPASPKRLQIVATSLIAINGRWEVRNQPRTTVTFQSRDAGQLSYNFAQMPRSRVTSFLSGTAVCAIGTSSLDASPQKGITRDTPIISCSGEGVEFTVTVYSPKSISVRFASGELWDLLRP